MPNAAARGCNAAALPVRSKPGYAAGLARSPSGSGTTSCSRHTKPSDPTPCNDGAPLLQLRRWGAVEHLALRPFQHVDHVGFDDERAALARDLRGLIDAAEQVLHRRTLPCLVNIEQLARKLRSTRLGHVDPADALALL